MSLKAELETWGAALKAYEEEDYAKSIELFERIADTSKILCNIGLIYATLGAHETAVDNFNAATVRDKHLAVAYFQCGVSNFLLGRFELAYKDFDAAFEHLRGNQYIDYEQLGLKFKLWSAEVLFNRGLCQIYLGNEDLGMRDLRNANAERMVKEHEVIDEAIQARGVDYTVFSIPVGVLYKPSESKFKNLKTKDYMGKAKLVAASETRDAFVEFHGVKRLEQGLGPQGQPVAMPLDIQKVGPTPARPVPTRSQTLNVGGSGGLDGGRVARSGSADDATGLGVTRKATIREMPNGVPTRGMTIGGGANRTRGNTDAGVLGRGDRPPARNGSPAPQREPVKAPAPPAKLPQQQQQPSYRVSPPPTPPRDEDGTTTVGGRGVMTQILDDYLGPSTLPYDRPPPVAKERGDRDRLSPADRERDWDPLAVAADSTRKVAAWQSKTVAGANPNIPPSRTPSAVVRKGSAMAKGGRYVEDAYDVGTNYGSEVPFEMMKIRIKLHYGDDTRGMAIPSQATFDEFVDMLTLKFSKRWGELMLKFKDEDGGRISLKDEMDWEMAVEVARETVNASTGKIEARLEVWLSDR